MHVEYKQIVDNRLLVQIDDARAAVTSRMYSVPIFASQMLTAFASMVWKTGSSSPGEVEMTPSTSEVAVCCSNASLSSRVRACTSSNRRAVSIAITAWSAKVVTNSICLSVNGRPPDGKWQSRRSTYCP